MMQTKGKLVEEVLWKDETRVPEAAEALKLTASNLTELGLIDGVIPEPLGGAHRDRELTYRNLGDVLERELEDLDQADWSRLPEVRREKFRRLGAIEGRFPVL